MSMTIFEALRVFGHISQLVRQQSRYELFLLTKEQLQIYLLTNNTA